MVTLRDRNPLGPRERFAGLCHAGGGVGVVLVERFGFHQRRGQAVQVRAVLGEELDHLLVGVVDQVARLLVEESLRLVGGLARAGQEGSLTLGRQQGGQTEAFAHPPAPDHRPGDLGELLQIGFRPGRDVS